LRVFLVFGDAEFKEEDREPDEKRGDGIGPDPEDGNSDDELEVWYKISSELEGFIIKGGVT